MPDHSGETYGTVGKGVPVRRVSADPHMDGATPEYRHKPGTGYIQRPDGAYVRADSLRYIPEPEPAKVIVYRGVPRCPWDGSAMPYTVFNNQRSIWDGPEPGYLFECEICGWEDEIS